MFYDSLKQDNMNQIYICTQENSDNVYAMISPFSNEDGLYLKQKYQRELYPVFLDFQSQFSNNFKSYDSNKANSFFLNQIGGSMEINQKISQDLKINLLSFEFEFIELADNMRFTSICGGDGKIWLTTADGKIIEWCLDGNIIKPYICQENQRKDCIYFDILKKDNYIIALPWNSKYVTVLEPDSGKIINIKLEEKLDEDMICMFGKIDKGYLYIFSHTTKKLYKICLATLKKEKEYIITEPEKDDVEFWEGYIDPMGDNTFYERNSNSLIQYIKYIQTNNSI